MDAAHSKGLWVLCAASLVSLVLGSVHAFSVFLRPLETLLDASRASISLLYSVALVSITIAVLLGPKLYARYSPTTLYAFVAILGCLGAIIAGSIQTYWAVILGYSLMFGIANGIGYGFGLQFAARNNPNVLGLAMGVVTAAYALGAVVAPYGFELALADGGFSQAMHLLGLVIFGAGAIAIGIIKKTQAEFSAHASTDQQLIGSKPAILITWLAYGAAVFAGLMAIGHAAGIAAIAGLAGWVAAGIIAICNLMGSLLSGWMSDRTNNRVLLMSLPVLSALSLVGLVNWPTMSLPLLGVIGFCYGGTIALYPAVIARRFPGDAGPKVYGLVFTAWGVAGLFAPWFAGFVFDQTGTYQLALIIASGLGILSSIAASQIR